MRAQAGGAGTVVNNLSALGVGEIHAIGLCGEDGEGYELRRALEGTPNVYLNGFEEQTGVDVSEATMSRQIARLPGGWPLKKSRS